MLERWREKQCSFFGRLASPTFGMYTSLPLGEILDSLLTQQKISGRPPALLTPKLKPRGPESLSSSAVLWGQAHDLGSANRTGVPRGSFVPVVAVGCPLCGGCCCVPAPGSHPSVILSLPSNLSTPCSHPRNSLCLCCRREYVSTNSHREPGGMPALVG